MQAIDIKRIIFVSLICLAQQAVAETEGDSAKKLSRITVLSKEEALQTFGGSATLITPEEMKSLKGGYDDVQKALQVVPGVNVQEEEGYGLRPNISFRGTPNERSEKITLMEDGVLIAPAPYSAPAAYYFPVFGRMEGLEILKGASQIKYGPNTLAGSLNMLSTSIPKDFKGHIRLQGGEDSSHIAHTHVGQSWEHGGVLVEAYDAETDGFKKLDNGGDTGYDLTDLVGKIRLNTDPKKEFYQQLDLKVQDYTQDSNETYLGLTDSDFDADPYRRYSGSQRDNIEVEHNTYQLNHFIQLTKDVDLSTVFYRNETERNWYKLDSVGGASLSSLFDESGEFAEQLSWVKGADSPIDSLKVRENKREYESQGIQSVLGVALETGDIGHEFEFGVRYHEDEEDRYQQDDAYQMLNGTMVLTKAGAPGSQDNRIGEADAWAYFIQDTMDFGALTLTPGLRYERVRYTRSDYGKNDPGREGIALDRVYTSTDVLIPGIGSTYKLSKELTAFAGVHKGFSPPGPQKTDDVKEEESINYETGVRYAKDTKRAEAAIFLNDYENLLGADTLSSGGQGTGDLFNAGEARSWGVELSSGYDIGLEHDVGVGIPVYVAYTYTDAEFRDSFDSSFFGTVVSGDSLPYIAENQLSLGIGVDIENVSLRIDGHYLDDMPVVPGKSGLRASEKTDSHFVVDLGASVEVKKGARIFAALKNAFDEEYIVARRPAGARPGLPQTFFAGVEFDL